MHSTLKQWKWSKWSQNPRTKLFPSLPPGGNTGFCNIKKGCAKLSVKGEVSNRNSCYQRAEPLLQRTECCPSRWAQSAQQPPASPCAGSAPAQGDSAVGTDPQSSADSWRTAQVCCSTALSSATGATICCLWSKPWKPPLSQHCQWGCPEAPNVAGKHSRHTSGIRKLWGALCTHESLVLWLLWWDSTKPRHQGSGAKGERKEKVLPFSSSLHFSCLEVEAQLHTVGLSHTMQCPWWVQKGQQGWSCEGLLHKDICFLPKKYRNSVWLKRNPQRQMQRIAFVSSQANHTWHWPVDTAARNWP